MVFNREQLHELLLAQESLNQKYTGSDWSKKIPISNFLMASFTETAEYFESGPRIGDKKGDTTLGWKHWKSDENEDQNLVIEAIDVLHFHLSIFLMLATVDQILDYNESEFELVERNDDDYPITHVLSDLSRFNLSVLEGDFKKSFVYSMKTLSTMMKHCDRTPEDIYNGYFKKNELNQKRVEGGYQTGEYKKHDENGVEDNASLEV